MIDIEEQREIEAMKEMLGPDGTEEVEEVREVEEVQEEEVIEQQPQ